MTKTRPKTGYIRRVFPGGNTSYGFHSFYDYIITPDANRIFVIKGGPGVGKSTFMKKIASDLLEKGFNIEYHHCSSDNDSLDGIHIPDLEIAIIDGTAPHIVDPKNPGAVDEIIHLGDYWNEHEMRKNKTEILTLNKEISRLFRRAYSYLAAAKIFLDEIEGYYKQTGILDGQKLNRYALRLIEETFHKPVTNGHPAKTSKHPVRHLFATAITPDGPVNYIETLVDSLNKRYIIEGDDGTGKNELITRLMDAALMHGYFVEAYHCSLDPTKIDHLIIPELSLAVINIVEPHFYTPQPGDKVINTVEFINQTLASSLAEERQRARDLYRQSFDLAIWYLRRAKELHDKIESYYVPNMNFQQIEDRRKQVLSKILEVARELGYVV